MNIALWIIAAILAFAFIAAGGMKLAKSRSDLAASGMEWVDGFSEGQIKAVGAVELAGGLGVVLPALVDIAPVLVPIAAAGLALTMVGAAVFHIRRNDPPASLAPSIVLGILAVVLAVGRFGPEAF
jgi:uncharacterized membrane protein YphA (DoxX/SURF4 family)